MTSLTGATRRHRLRRFCAAAPLVAALVVLGPAVMVGAQQVSQPINDSGPLAVTSAPLTIENPQPAWRSNELVQIRFDGCQPRIASRLELRRNLSDGVPVAVYPAPTANVGGIVRASVRLPTDLRSVGHHLVLQCTTPDGRAITATASLEVEPLGQDRPPQRDTAANPAPGNDQTPAAAVANDPPEPPGPGPDQLARTGVEAGTVLVSAALAALCGSVLLILTRRRTALRWSPAGTPLTSRR
jgi:hypothetical protein